MNTEKEELAALILTYLSPQGLRGMRLMTAAGPFALEQNGLSFRFKGSPKANHVRIILNSMDLFDVKLGKVKAGNYEVIYEGRNISCDVLGQTFRDQTGLETQVPTILSYNH